MVGTYSRNNEAAKMNEAISVSELLDLDKTIAKDLFNNRQYVWDVLPALKSYILTLGASLDSEIYEKRGEDIWIAKSARIFPSAYVDGPCIIDEYAEVRHCAFIRGSVIVGKKCVVGNSTELKNALLFDEVQVPHYNYVGDSVLGYKSHMGAGAITSNVKADRSVATLRVSDQIYDTGLKKFGAIMGDYVEVGCNSVLNPATIIGRKASIYPLSMVRGYVSANSIYKNQNDITRKIENES